MTPLLATSWGEEMAPMAILAIFLAVSAGLWTGICARWRRGAPIIPLARRRPVPWQAQDVLFLFLIGLLLLIMAAKIVEAWMGPDAAQQAADQKPELAHPTEQLLGSRNPGMIAVAITMAVIVAPLFEEFFFRVLLQGWLEAVWSRRRRRHPGLRATPVSWIPVVLPAVIFALVHLRFAEIPRSLRYLTGIFLGQMAGDLMTLGLAIVLLRYAVGARAADLGWRPETLRHDASLGLLALLAAVPPVLAIHVVSTVVVKKMGINFALDPIPLFFLALVLGALYRRTHRIAPSLVLHMAFNATSIALYFLGP
jgi:membrane protease YdiL (CAAX protease family)